MNFIRASRAISDLYFMSARFMHEKNLKMWLRDSRVGVVLLIWAVLSTMGMTVLYNRLNGGGGVSSVGRAVEVNGKVRSMKDLVNSKSKMSEKGLGYEYEAGRKCPYDWRGGSPSGMCHM